MRMRCFLVVKPLFIKSLKGLLCSLSIDIMSVSCEEMTCHSKGSPSSPFFSSLFTPKIVSISILVFILFYL